jgi:protein arginine N-methyltransferase 1
MSRLIDGLRYHISDYGFMMASANRMEAFVEALSQSVTKDSVVIDLGAGTGVFALLACRFGARRVYAIDPNDAIAVAEELAAENGFSDRLVCIQDLSTSVELPERADLIVSDLRGMVPLFENHLPTIIDARERLLKPDGTLIPRGDRIWAALVEAEKPYSNLVDPWDDGRFGLDMSAGRRYVVNDTRTYEFKPEHLLSEAQVWTDLDYKTITFADVDGELEWVASRKGTAHGIALWFESELADGVGYQTGPEHLDDMHRCLWLSFYQPIEVEADDVIWSKVSARLVEADYVWRWQTGVGSGDGTARLELDQSDFFGMPRGRKTLRRGRAEHAPELDLDGQIDRFILDSMDGAASLQEIAQRVAGRYPESFDNPGDALSRVAKLSLRYGK